MVYCRSNGFHQQWTVPVFELPLVVVELDAGGVLHPAHDVDDVLLVDNHLAAGIQTLLKIKCYKIRFCFKEKRPDKIFPSVESRS